MESREAVAALKVLIAEMIAAEKARQKHTLLRLFRDGIAMNDDCCCGRCGVETEPIATIESFNGPP